MFSLTFASKWLNIAVMKIELRFSDKCIYLWLSAPANYFLKKKNKKPNSQPNIFQETGAQTSSRKSAGIGNITVKIAIKILSC